MASFFGGISRGRQPNHTNPTNQTKPREISPSHLPNSPKSPLNFERRTCQYSDPGPPFHGKSRKTSVKSRKASVKSRKTSVKSQQTSVKSRRTSVKSRRTSVKKRAVFRGLLGSGRRRCCWWLVAGSKFGGARAKKLRTTSPLAKSLTENFHEMAVNFRETTVNLA